jgi:hypothetical protein
LKAATVRKLAQSWSVAELDAAAEKIVEHEQDVPEIDGDDLGEKLTHIMLARRVRDRVDQGQPFKEAFRETLSGVRGVLTNRPTED